jgi:hypothetical protein
MIEDQAFDVRVREHCPEGLTGLFAIGATRRTFILETQPEGAEDPGAITDFSQMGDFLLERYFSFCEKFFILGGQNAIVSILSPRSFFERGEKYAAAIVPETLRLINDISRDLYTKMQVDPYFIGLEPLLHQPIGSPPRFLAETLQAFMADWNYQDGRRKILWEVASIPLLSFWQVAARADAVTRQEIEAFLESTTDLEAIQKFLYQRFSKVIFGTSIPMPHFYLGNNMSGDLKFRSPMSLALTAGEYIQAYYTPYPLLFITLESFEHIIEDLLFGARFHAPKAYDYTGQYTPELFLTERERIQKLASNPESTLGLARKIQK